MGVVTYCVGSLDGRAVGNWVGEGGTEFEDVYGKG